MGYRWTTKETHSVAKTIELDAYTGEGGAAYLYAQLRPSSSPPHAQEPTPSNGTAMRPKPALLRDRIGTRRILFQGLAMLLAVCASIAPLTRMVAPGPWQWRALAVIVASVATVTVLKLVVRRRAWLAVGWLVSGAIALVALVPRPLPVIEVPPEVPAEAAEVLTGLQSGIPAPTEGSLNFETLWRLTTDGIHQFKTSNVVIEPGQGMVWLLTLGTFVVVGILLALLEFSPAPAFSGLVISAAFGTALFYTSERLPWCVAAIVVSYLAVLVSYRRGVPRPARGLARAQRKAAIETGNGPAAFRSPKPRPNPCRRFAAATAALGVAVVAAILAAVVAPHTALWESAYGFESLLGPRWSSMVSTSLDVGVSRSDIQDRLVGTVRNGLKTAPDPLRLYTAKDFDGETWTAEPPPALPDAVSLSEYTWEDNLTLNIFLKYGAPTYLPIQADGYYPQIGKDNPAIYNPITGVAALPGASTNELTYQSGKPYPLELPKGSAAILPSRVVERNGVLVYADRQDSLAYTPTIDDVARPPEDVEGVMGVASSRYDDGLEVMVMNPDVTVNVSTGTDADTNAEDGGTSFTYVFGGDGYDTAYTTLRITSAGELIGTLPDGLPQATLDFFSDPTRMANYVSNSLRYQQQMSEDVLLADGTPWRNPFPDYAKDYWYGLGNLTVPSVSDYLGVPADIAPRLKELTLQVTAEATTDSERATAIQNYLRKSGGFVYTTEIEPPAQGESPVTAFLDSKRGYCIQFATAMVLMARSIGMPARLDVGYLVNKPWKDGWAITSKNAHAWPEIMFANYSWIRYEPTPAIQSGSAPTWAPEPVSAPSTAAAIPSADPAVLPTMAAPSGSAKPTPVPTSAKPSSSVAAALATNESTIDSSKLWSGTTLALLILALAAVYVARRRALPSGTAADELIWSQLARSAHGAGLDWPDSRTPRQVASDLALKIEDTSPEAAAKLRGLAARVEQARYSSVRRRTKIHATRKDAALIKTAIRRAAAAQSEKKPPADG